jgi:YVTN family beta-propeller protein
MQVFPMTTINHHHLHARIAAMSLLLLMLAAPPAWCATLFVTNERGNTVTVLDSTTLKTIKTIPTGQRPRGIVAGPQGKWVYVCVGDSNRIDVIDVAKLAVTRQLPSGADPELLAVSNDGSRVYIANEDNSQVTVLDSACASARTTRSRRLLPKAAAWSISSTTRR